MIMDISGLFTRIFFFFGEGPIDGLATVDMQPLYKHVFKFTDTLASIARFFQTCDKNLILERAGSYSNTSKRCNLRLAEVFHNLFTDKHPSLNKKE